MSPEFSELGDKYLMTSEEFSQSLTFQNTRISPTILSDWGRDPTDQVRKWKESWKYHTVSDETRRLWQSLYNDHEQKTKEMAEVQTIKLIARFNPLILLSFSQSAKFHRNISEIFNEENAG